MTTRRGRRRNGCCSAKARASWCSPAWTARPIAPDTFTSWVARVAKRAGVSHIMPVHGLRHTHITNLLRANVHPKVASERAGHSSVGFTLDRYSHVIPSLQEDAALRIDAALRKILGS